MGLSLMIVVHPKMPEDFRKRTGEEPWLETPSGTYMPYGSFNRLDVYTDCRIDKDVVFFKWPDVDGPHTCIGNRCSAYYREKHDVSFNRPRGKANWLGEILRGWRSQWFGRSQRN